MKEAPNLTDPEMFNKLMALAKRRGILWPSFDIYGGTAGFFEYGPMGAQIKNNIEDIWRRYYIIGEGFEEIKTSIVAPEAVFKASGHLSEFSDLLVECVKCGDAFRADHLIEEAAQKDPEHLRRFDLEAHKDQLGPDPTAISFDGLSTELTDEFVRHFSIRCPTCGGDLGPSKPFNLMFRTQIGAGGKRVGYLRPETAQGMFVNFQTLYRHARERLPFGVVQIGTVFRNEISPRQGMLRLREFNQAEAEIFVHPDEKTHVGFEAIARDELNLVPAETGPGVYTVGEAVQRNIIKSHIVAYYVALTARYLLEVGIDPKRLRFRQHGPDEMAHYASDCWDAEAQTSFGWIELVGIADRTCFDLESHAQHSGEDLKAFQRYDEPKEFRVIRVVADQKFLGPMFKKDARAVATALEGLDPEQVRDKDSVKVTLDGREVEVPKEGFTIIEREIKETGLRFTPHVIEPSYGIDRIIYGLLEHAFVETEKEGEEYRVLRLRPSVAPIKVGVFPLMAKDGLPGLAMGIDVALRARGIRTYYDDGGTVGRRYARMDEIGTPWCVVVDYGSKDDGKATIRDRDTTEQVRMAMDAIPEGICRLLDGKALKDL